MKAEEKSRYFTETALALNRAGFHAEKILGGTLGVWLDDEPLCEVSEVGGITYRGENIATPEREAAKDKAYEIVRTTAEYMRQMEQAPPLKAVGLEDRYKLLADFNGTVLAGMESKYGVQFVTWDWDHDRKSLSHGHYFTNNYDGAKQDFATRSGLIQEQQLILSIRVRNALTEEWQKSGVQQGREYAILTDEITKAWSGMSTRQYKNMKGLKKENLRDNMSDMELILNMLAESTSTEISKAENPASFEESKAIAKRGGNAAKQARLAVETETGKPVITSQNAAELNAIVTNMIESVANSSTEDE